MDHREQITRFARSTRLLDWLVSEQETDPVGRITVLRRIDCKGERKKGTRERERKRRGEGAHAARMEGSKQGSKGSYRGGSVTIVIQRCPVVEQTSGASQPNSSSQASSLAGQPTSHRHPVSGTSTVLVLFSRDHKLRI